MKTPDILNAVAGTVLVLAASGAVAGHEAPYRYNEASDTIVFSYHGKSAASHVQVASAGPVSIADHSDSSQGSDDSFLEQ
jgi:hypothetical protein